MFSLPALVFSPLIVLLAYVIFSIAGFGSTLVSIPLLAHLFPLKFLLPLVVLLDCVGAFSQGIRLRANVYRQELLPLLPFMLAGMAAGVFILMRVPSGVLLGLLGGFAMTYGTMYALSKGAAFRLARWTVAPIGATAGMCSSLFGVGGPIYVMYLTARGATTDHIRATIPVIFMFTTIGRIILYGAAGLFTLEVLIAGALLLPVMFLGLYVGNRMHLNLNRDTLIRIVGALLILSGASLIVRALSGG